MESIPLPSKTELVEVRKDHAQLTIEPCYPGYGTTLGNTLRRVLLSSLAGAAVTAVKIEGADHEFSTLPYVKEDVVSIILNLKLLRFKLHETGPVTLSLNVKGEKQATGADFQGPSSVEVVNAKQPIATLTDKTANLNMEIVVSHGRGYVPVENREKEKLDVGWIAIDAVYTPVKTVNFSIEHVRVGQITNYDRLILDVETDGTLKPAEAIREAAKILVAHFTPLSEGLSGTPTELPKKKRTRTKKEDVPANPANDSSPGEVTTEAPDASS